MIALLYFTSVDPPLLKNFVRCSADKIIMLTVMEDLCGSRDCKIINWLSTEFPKKYDDYLIRCKN